MSESYKLVVGAADGLRRAGVATDTEDTKRATVDCKGWEINGPPWQVDRSTYDR
jgi:hypothetical protein